MKLFSCTNCGQLLFFENNTCERCGFPLGFDVNRLQLLPLVEIEPGTFNIFKTDSAEFHYCANHSYGICNWLVPDGSNTPFCSACSLNRTIPNLQKPEHFSRWKVLENAKHRLVYSLLCMNLPVVSKVLDPVKGLFFDFIADKSGSTKHVLTGHNDGLITININEADDIEREMTRKAMDEVYRTVLGHFRHEVGHYYWDLLIDHSVYIDEFRELFGDERADYPEALLQHYKHGPPAGWNLEFISSYASTHPWEDWAESWAHYLHIVDTLETAYAFGLSVQPVIVKSTGYLGAHITDDPYRMDNFNDILNLWLPFTFALNSVNRSMGHADLYPFVIRPRVISKLEFIHKICHNITHRESL